VKTVCSIPNFLRGLQSKSIELLIPYAFAQFLTAAHVPITITGDTSTWNKSGKGALFIGDHRNGLEYFLLLATMGYVGRDDIKVIAKPYSLSVRLTEALDVHHGEYALAVIPNTLASDRRNIFNRDIGMRLLYRRELSTQNEAKAINATAMKDAASFLSHGHVVGIYPTGGVKCATTSDWYRGVGEIIKLLPEEARERVVIVPFQFDHFTQFQLICALWLHSKGHTRKQRTIELHLGKQLTVADFLASEAIDCSDTRLVTERLRTRYIQDFTPNGGVKIYY